MENKKKYLVTGGTGFFGKNLLARLQRDRCIVHVLEADLMNEHDLRFEVGKFQPDIVYHLGAYVNLDRTYEVAKTCIDVNIRGTLNLLDSLVDTKFDRFIYSSTEEVYGDGELPFKESQLLYPPSFYAVSKVATEQLISIYSQMVGFKSIIFRVGTAYGNFLPKFRLIPQIVIKAIKNKDILLNSGLKKRDYIFIEDVVDAFILASDVNIKKQKSICNLGGGQSYTLRYLVECVLRETKSLSKVIYGAYPDRVLEADEWLLDNTEAKKQFGWLPKTTFESGIAKTIAFYIHEDV
ncbi:GDP-mannose 4,6-dehydratase [Candidatus Gottesmanbacteria bacterium]|nr:GDP-mannose 4,6-dehydratase [Candidatus Gottesmanbacteria bacterium]